ncbi:hypothetical protein ACIBBB_35700 [Streptomyces sp. NPDC051217]|uniref:hypothetical protein n=1 Tax=Streptomyces sp. NPDC051217 TaxID=3365644 RepID=UPI00379D9DAF
MILGYPAQHQEGRTLKRLRDDLSLPMSSAHDLLQALVEIDTVKLLGQRTYALVMPSSHTPKGRTRKPTAKIPKVDRSAALLRFLARGPSGEGLKRAFGHAGLRVRPSGAGRESTSQSGFSA